MASGLSRSNATYAAYTVGFVISRRGFGRALSRRACPALDRLRVSLFTIVTYAAIGVFSRTADVAEYYVAGRRGSLPCSTGWRPVLTG